MACKLHQEVELGPGERDVGAVAGHGAAGLVDPERSQAEPWPRPVPSALAVAAERGPDAGDQLRHLERLAHVVVSARLEAHDHVDRVRAGGEHDDGRRGLAADGTAHLETVESGEHDVEQHQVGTVSSPAVQPVGAVGGRRHREAGHGRPSAITRGSTGRPRPAGCGRPRGPPSGLSGGALRASSRRRASLMPK